MKLSRLIDAAFVLALVLILGSTGAYLYVYKLPAMGKLTLQEFEPVTTLRVEEHPVERPRFPVFDTHIHLRFSGLSAREVVAIMDSVNVRRLVNLEINWNWGDVLVEQVNMYQQKYPDRFLTAANIDFSGIDDPDFSDRALSQLEESYRLGARAIKVWRNLGLHVKDSSGKLVPIDDPRLDPLWRRAGELGMPVIFHIADASAFWQPVDEHNERYEEMQARLTPYSRKWGNRGPRFETIAGPVPKIRLMRHPFLLYYNPYQYPPKNVLIAQRDRVIRRHPETTFIGAHIASYPEDLAFVGRELDELPNLYLDMSHRIPELGRQPYTARAFFLKYQDRITFGLDGPPEIEAYRASFRFLETKDEYFDYPRARSIPQGRWKIYGLGLPDSVLKKIYFENAQRIFSPTYSD